jgi:hypothetical protein
MRMERKGRNEMEETAAESCRVCRRLNLDSAMTRGREK